MPNAKPAAPSQAKPKTPPNVKGPSGIDRNAKSGEFVVAVGPKTARALAPQRANINAIMEVLGEKIEQSQKSGRSAEFKIRIDPKEGARIFAVGDPPQPAPETRSGVEKEDQALDRALDAARERGRLRAIEILNGEDMLSAEEFAALLGVSRMTVNTKRQRHEVLALDGPKRGYRFPAWQVDENGKPFAALPELFALLGDSPWTIYRFLMQRHPELGGARGADLLHRGRSDEVLEAAESAARGALG